MAKIHPPVTPTPPLWRGVSELYGPTGDPLYGFYDRSDNIQVRDMGSVEKRRGYERAFDELFHMAASVAVGRDESSLVFLAVDDEGVKVLSSLPQTEYEEFTLDHPGFMQDDFTRANDTDIQTGTTLPWIEGADSEEDLNHDGENFLKINTNALRLAYADGTSGYADWDLEAQTPYHTLRVEMDMSDVALSTAQNAGIFLFMGLPDFYEDQGVIVKNRIWSVDGKETYQAGASGSDHAWAGIGLKFSINAKATGDEVISEVFEFGSNKPQENRDDRVGRRVWWEQKVGAILATGSSRVSWVLELGRRLNADGGWSTRLDVYRNKTIATLETGDVSTLYATFESPTAAGQTRKVNGDAGGGYLWNLPFSGKGGYAGLRLFTAGTPSGGTIRVERVKPAFDFAFYQFQA